MWTVIEWSVSGLRYYGPMPYRAADRKREKLNRRGAPCVAIIKGRRRFD